MNKQTKDKFDRAVELCENSQFDEARPVLEEVLKEAPENSEAWRLAAQVDWQRFNDTDKAYNELIESLKLDPKNKWALLLMGNLLAKGKNDIPTAKDYYNKVLEYFPEDIIAINNIAGIMVGEKQYDDAIDLFKRALKLNKTYANSYYGIAYAYYLKGDLKSAFEYCHKGAINSVERPENPGTLQELYRFYIRVAQELDQRTNYPRIWNKIKNKLEVIGNEPIRFETDENLKVYAKLEYGLTHNKKENIIKYNPKRQYVAHLFVHEMMHLEMILADSKIGKGKVFVTTPENSRAFRKKYYQFFRKKHHALGNEAVEATYNQIFEGISLQVLNCPLDLFVEDKIYNEYPEMRPVQMLSLMRIENESIQAATNKQMNDFFPKDIVRDNKVMNLCTSLHLKQLYGIDLIKEYHATRDEYNQAKDLYDEYRAYVDTFKTGDEYEMLEYFASSLNFDDYYTLLDEKEFVNYQYKKNEEASALEKALRNKTGMSAEDVDVANAQFALEHQDGSDSGETMMMAMYMLSAMQYFDGMSKEKVKRTAFEIATIGINGISPKKTYKLKTIPHKDFGGYQLLAYYYVSWAIAIPEMLDKLQLPFTKAYDIAKMLHGKKVNGEKNDDK